MMMWLELIQSISIGNFIPFIQKAYCPGALKGKIIATSGKIHGRPPSPLSNSAWLIGASALKVKPFILTNRSLRYGPQFWTVGFLLEPEPPKTKARTRAIIKTAKIASCGRYLALSLGTDLVLPWFLFSIAFDVFDNFRSYVSAGDLFYPETGAGINF